MESGSTQWTNKAITVVATIMGVFHLYTAFFGTLTAMWQRSIHLGLSMLVAYLIAAGKAKRTAGRVVSLVSAAVAVGSVAYILLEFDNLIERFGTPNSADIFVGTVIILLVLDFTRRQVGKILPGIAVVFLLYSVAGPYLPGILWHRGYDIPRIVNQIALSTEGIFGTPLGVSADYIFLFVLFGGLLEVTGIGQFYIDLAVKSVGKSPGGPAKAAVVASGLFGTISGSAVANVVGTGTVTIPLMKSIGYKPAFAAAVEAVASTGGQIMPPLMGAAAFIMSEILGIPYYKVALGALVPALTYYGSVFAMVHFTARRDDLKGADTAKMPSIGHMFRTKGLYMLPLIVLIVMLVVAKISVIKAAVYSVAVTLAIGFFVSKMKISQLIDAFEKSARTALVVVTSASCAGIIVAVINLTGLGMRFSNLMLSLAGSSLLLVLVLLMLASLLLGMGLPTTPAYMILAVLGAPSLVRLGVDPLAAHLFVFYFGAISMITPPVALAVYAATGIAESDFWKTGLYSVLLGLPAFIVPFMFVYNPELVGRGTPTDIIIAGVTAVIGAVLLGAGLSGWLVKRASIVERVILVVSGFMLIDPGQLTNGLGLAGLALVYILQRSRKSVQLES